MLAPLYKLNMHFYISVDLNTWTLIQQDQNEMSHFHTTYYFYTAAECLVCSHWKSENKYTKYVDQCLKEMQKLLTTETHFAIVDDVKEFLKQNNQ